MSSHSNATHPEHYDSDEFENLSDSAVDPPLSDPNAAYIELEDDDFPDYYDVIDGRLYHRDISAPYPLPVDGPELNRYKACHNILKRLLRGNYTGPVQDVLAPSASEHKKVLDICNGDGKWVVEMCEEFPHVEFEGVDLVPNSTRYPPDNARFVLDDVNHGLDYGAGSFNFVQARDTAMAIRDYQFLVEETARVLKPGGLFLSLEWSRRPSFLAGDPRHLDIEAPASMRFHNILDQALRNIGVESLPRQCSAILGASSLFSDVEMRALAIPIIPIGGSHETAQFARIGGWVRSAQAKLARACKRLLLLHSGLSATEVETVTEEYVRELRSVYGLVVTVYIAHGTRI